MTAVARVESTPKRAPIAPQNARRLKTGLLVAAIAATGFGADQLAHAPQADAAQQDIVRPSTAKQTADKQRLMDIINQYRAQNGLQPVKVSAQLSGIVQSHSDTLMAQETVWHSTAFLNDPRTGRYNHANEVIALSYQDDVQQLLDWWKTSPAHNAALLNPKAQVMGIGLTYSDGSLSNTGAPWKILSTINLYGYPAGQAPADASTHVNGAASAVAPVVKAAPAKKAALAAPTHAIQRGIASGYYRDGGAAVFGQPTNNEQCSATGACHQDFANGWTITWAPGLGAHAVESDSAIGTQWNAAGAQQGYGSAATNQAPTVTGQGDYQVFKKGRSSTKLVSSTVGGTQVVNDYGGIDAYWSSRGADATLGFPTTGEYKVGRDTRQNFTSGVTLSWDSMTQRVREIR